MGGNALKNIVETRRYARSEFDYLSAWIIEKLTPVFEHCAIVPFYRKKESFGDCDVLVRNDKGQEPLEIVEVLKEIFFNNQEFPFVLNDNCISFKLEELQIDLIISPPEFYDIHLVYLSYNDLGNFMGRVAHSMFDVKYGHRGLHAPVRTNENTHQLGEILISRDAPSIFKFLGFDFERFRDGFDTLEDIFNYVIKSKYFRREVYNLDKLNHINRTRNRKRKTYQQFLEYLEKNNIQDGTLTPTHTVDSFFPEAEFTKKKEVLVKRADAYKKQHSRLVAIYQEVYKGVDQIQMGKAIAELKRKFANQSEYVTFVKVTSDEDLKEIITNKKNNH